MKSKKKSGSNITLRQLCCHPLISDKEREILGNLNLSLDEVKQGLIKHHQQVIETYSKKLENLDPTNQSYNMLKKNFTDKVNDSKYLLNIFSKLVEEIKPNDEENTCCICMDNINQIVITQCGHIYCKECIFNALKFKKNVLVVEKD